MQLPYIEKRFRRLYDEHVEKLANVLGTLLNGDDPFDSFPGELNYVITSLISKLLKKLPKKYSKLSMLKGVLQDVVDEFQERIMKPYEEKKRKENGDVY